MIHAFGLKIYYVYYFNVFLHTIGTTIEIDSACTQTQQIAKILESPFDASEKRVLFIDLGCTVKDQKCISDHLNLADTAILRKWNVVSSSSGVGWNIACTSTSIALI